VLRRSFAVLLGASLALAGCSTSKTSGPNGQNSATGPSCASSFETSAYVGPQFLQSVGEVNYPIAWFLNLQTQHTALGVLLQVNSQQDYWRVGSNVHRPAEYSSSTNDSGSVSGSNITLKINDGGPMDGTYIGTWTCNSLTLSFFGSQNVSKHTFTFEPTTYVKWTGFVARIEKRYPFGFYCANGRKFLSGIVCS